MRQLNLQKISTLPTADGLLDEKYGAAGTTQRAEFDAASQQWYSAVMKEDVPTASYRVTLPVDLYQSISQRAKLMGQNVSSYIAQVLAQDAKLTY